MGGSGAVVDALVRGIERHGGSVRLSTHVERINVEAGRAVGVTLRGGEVLPDPDPDLALALALALTLTLTLR